MKLLRITKINFTIPTEDYESDFFHIFRLQTVNTKQEIIWCEFLSIHDLDIYQNNLTTKIDKKYGNLKENKKFY